MAPATGTALLILVAFVLPGFITLVVRESSFVIRDVTVPFERLLLSLTYSALIYGILVVCGLVAGMDAGDVAAFYNGRRGLGEYAALGFMALLFLPIAISEIGRYWSRSSRWREATLAALRIPTTHSTRSAWDHFFSGNAGALVRATLDDGRVVAGYFGEYSLAAYSERKEDLFLERRWELDDDDWFLRQAPSSLGLWLPHERVISLEAYEPLMLDDGGVAVKPWSGDRR